MHLVFSYGTLKDKFHRAKATEGVLEANYRLDNYGSYPMLKPSSSPMPHKIPGYVLELTQAQFVETDRYEGYPDLYDRMEMNIRCGDEVVRAWVYVQGDMTK